MRLQLSRGDVQQGLADLAEAYGKNPEFIAPRVVHYYEALRDLDPRFFRDAIRLIIKTATGYFPMPAVIREAAQKAQKTYLELNAQEYKKASGENAICGACGTVEWYLKPIMRPVRWPRRDETDEEIAAIEKEEITRITPRHFPHCKLRQEGDELPLGYNAVA